ncbi:RluA family pseudouridine synthase [Oligoflexaceae bacterium]|nr:RluA family pseudouridine synthase [Oligoflexaceae bacterium]
MKFKSEKEISLIDLMKIKVGGSVSNIKKKIKHQDIFINGELVVGHNPQVPANSIVEIRGAKRLTNESISILYEDDDLIAVEKPPGILSIQSLKDKDHTLFGKVNKYLIQKSHNSVRAFIVHRLDQKVSGVILFAKSKAVSQALSDNWFKFEKIYHAVVEGCPNPRVSRIESWLHEDRNFKVHSSPDKRPGSKLAITNYQVEKKFRQHSLLSVKLETGKKNQIRVHLAGTGCPIIGDVKYGSSSNPIGRIGLHAHTLKIIQPVTGEWVVIHSPSPASFFNFV